MVRLNCHPTLKSIIGLYQRSCELHGIVCSSLLLSEVGGLFLWPTFLDEDSAHYEMLPIILPKLRLKMNSKRLTRRKKIVLGMRIEQLSSIGGWGDEESAVDILYLFPHKNGMGVEATQQTLFVPEFSKFKKTYSLSLHKEELINYHAQLNKIIIGIDLHGKKFSLNAHGVQFLTTAQMCETIKTVDEIIYDRSSTTTFLFNHTGITDFVWPIHESLFIKLNWIKTEGFLGVGLSSIAMDYDPNFTSKIRAGLQIVNATGGQKPFRSNRDLSSRVDMERIGQQPPTIECEDLCGVRENLVLNVVRDTPSAESDTRTFGGHQLTAPFYPWVVFIKVYRKCKDAESPMFMTCTGVLITLRHVATAAHCVHWRKSLVAECDGRENMRNKTGFRLVKKEELFVSYGSNDMQETWIMGLSYTLNKRRGVSTICLSKKLKLWHGQIATVVGRGDGETVTLHSNGNMNELLVPIVSGDYCKKVLADNGIEYDADSFLCAGSKNRGILPGDCGGPLMVERGGLFYAAGLAVSSYSPPSLRNILPDSYTAVNEHCDFIAQSTLGEAKCLENEYTEHEVEAKCSNKFQSILYENYQATCSFIGSEDDEENEKVNGKHRHNSGFELGANKYLVSLIACDGTSGNSLRDWHI
uniref:Peptidase S1 domain-containing protein n=1 Tax=Globodera pallida TaxID=36090 RepID=A0A183BPB0_GLOPA